MVNIRCLMFAGPDVPLERGTLSVHEDDWELLGRFVRYEAELAQSTYVRAGKPNPDKVAWSAEPGWLNLRALMRGKYASIFTFFAQ